MLGNNICKIFQAASGIATAQKQALIVIMQCSELKNEWNLESIGQPAQPIQDLYVVVKDSSFAYPVPMNEITGIDQNCPSASTVPPY